MNIHVNRRRNYGRIVRPAGQLARTGQNPNDLGGINLGPQTPHPYNHNVIYHSNYTSVN